jgi:hypothetical protein
MTAQPAALHTDTNARETSSSYADRGDGTNDWHIYVKVRDAAAAGILKLEDAPHVSGDAGVMALAVRQDTLAALAGTTGDYIPLTTDAFGRLSTVARPSSSDTAGWTRVASAGALATSLVVKASAGRLRLVRVTSTLGAVQYLQLHNATSLPANGATPAHVVAIPANSSAELDLGELGDYFATGIVAAVSTTAATLTVGAADSVFSALFV